MCHILIMALKFLHGGLTRQNFHLLGRRPNPVQCRVHQRLCVILLKESLSLLSQEGLVLNSLPVSKSSSILPSIPRCLRWISMWEALWILRPRRSALRSSLGNRCLFSPTALLTAPALNLWGRPIGIWQTTCMMNFGWLDALPGASDSASSWAFGF